MKWFHWVLLICIMSGCAHRGNIIEIGGYTFLYEGKEYRIQSVTPTLTEGYNVLTRREDETLVFKATDKEQDGILDEVTIGDLTPEQADNIYREGIAEGERRGYIKKRTFAREYRFNDDLRNYVLASYLLATGELYNKLIITDRTTFKSKAEVQDHNADGILDDVIQGTDTLRDYQAIYKYVLDKGLRTNRIRKYNGKLVVIP